MLKIEYIRNSNTASVLHKNMNEESNAENLNHTLPALFSLGKTAIVGRTGNT
jgi:hypothetical protein